jgi:serine/threonine protein kinase/tetratricopeptide (TPR) repeat protein
LYRSALARAPEQRPAFLDDACGRDEDLKRQIEWLLAEDHSGDGLLHHSAPQLLDDFSMPRLDVGAALGPYLIEGLLGAGGMGEVYLAHDPRLERRVAIKLLPERLMSDAVASARLRQEALAAAALDHPFICKIFEVGDHDGTLYFVMEYVRGETLFARLRAGRVPLPEALRIAGEIAEAVEEAHANRFVHRDLKPANITLTTQGHVKVMDFGLVKRIDWREPASSEATTTVDHMTGRAAAAGLTASATLLGTPEYMSPEQARGGAIDHRSDLFAFGIVLAELINGRHPFERSSRLDTVSAILHDSPDLTVPEDHHVPAGLLVLIRRLLAKSPDERYESMRDVRTDMARLTDAPVVSMPDAHHTRVIGRDGECATLWRLLDAAIAGRGSLALISGEPGIGKTHLTRAIQTEAARRGCMTISGHCYEMEGAPPYVPFVEMLEYSARALPRDTFRHALGDAASEIARLMPELRRLFPDIPSAIELPVEQRRRFMFNAYREFIERGARVSPCVAVFEDLHWADDSTLLLLQHLAQGVASIPVLLIGTYRDVELDVNRPLARTLETWLREKQALHIPLRRLPLAGIGQLLETLSGHTPPPSAARIVFDHTDGNPFFVEEVFRHLADEGRLFDQQGEWQQGLRAAELRVPQGVRLVIGHRLERLPPEARQILTTAAVIGRSFDLRLLEHLEGARPDAVLEAVEAAERARLLEIDGAGPEVRYRFAHELIRQTLASALSMPRRQRVHLRIADALEQMHAANLDPRAPVLAHHLFQAGAAADADRTVSWLTRAASQAAGGTAFEDALAHLDNALSLLPGEQSLRVAELLVERANVLRSLGRMPEAVAGFDQAVALFQSQGAGDRAADTCVPLAMIHSWTARLDEAREVCRRGLASLTSVQSPAGLLLTHALALGAVLANDIDAGLAAFSQVEKVELPPVPPLVRAILQMRTLMRAMCADLDAARQVADETDRVCESAGDVWGQSEIAWIRADLASVDGRLDDAIAIAHHAIPLAERIGHWGSACFSKWFLYDGLVAAGDLAKAADLAQVIDEYDRTHYVPWSVVGKVSLASIARLRGRVDEAVHWCQQATIPERNHWGGYPHAALALTLAQAGDPRASQALGDALRFVPIQGRPAPYGRWHTLNLTIEALAFAGRLDDAAALHPVAEDMIGRGYALMKASALPRTTAGIAAACAGHWSLAEAHHQTAIHQADTWPHRVCQPIARYWYADMLRARGAAGDTARAQDLLTDARNMAESVGMPLYARHASEKLGDGRATMRTT